MKAEVSYLTSTLNQGETQTLVDHMYQTVLTICGMPNRNGGTSTSDTGSAVIMRDGWSAAEARAKDSELMFKKSERIFLKLILNICKTLKGMDLKVCNIEIRFTRRNYENILQKAQVLDLILLMDFSKYYDNIRHDKLMELFEKYVDDDTALWFLEKIVDNEKVDVSYMSDEEYESAMDDVFNSLEHEKVDKSLLTGKKFLRKHLNIGDQVAQDAGIAYPIPIDNYIKIVKGVKFYGRYMDDSYVIHRDKEFLKGLLIEIVEIAHDLGITVNLRKTRICKLSEMWRFLQIQYSLTDTGRVIHKIHPKRLTGMRRKAKKLALILSEKDFDDWFRSWFNGHCHYMSKLQRSNMLDLCKKLKEEHYYGKTDFS